MRRYLKPDWLLIALLVLATASFIGGQRAETTRPRRSHDVTPDDNFT